jgi:hypothetical protein
MDGYDRIFVSGGGRRVPVGKAPYSLRASVFDQAGGEI